MDRQQAIAKARYLRCGATVLDMSTGMATEFTGPIPKHFINHVKTVEKDGKENIVSRHRTKFEPGPSVSAAKRFTRAQQPLITVAAKDKNEATRFYLMAKQVKQKTTTQGDTNG